MVPVEVLDLSVVAAIRVVDALWAEKHAADPRRRTEALTFFNAYTYVSNRHVRLPNAIKLVHVEIIQQVGQSLRQFVLRLEFFRLHLQGDQPVEVFQACEVLLGGPAPEQLRLDDLVLICELLVGCIQVNEASAYVDIRGQISSVVPNVE